MEIEKHFETVISSCSKPDYDVLFSNAQHAANFKTYAKLFDSNSNKMQHGVCKIASNRYMEWKTKDSTGLLFLREYCLNRTGSSMSEELLDSCLILRYQSENELPLVG